MKKLRTPKIIQTAKDKYAAAQCARDEAACAWDGETVAEGSPEPKKLDVRLRDIELPTALMKQYQKEWVAAIIALIATIVLIVELQSIQCVLGFILTGFFVYMAISIKLDYASGRIREVVTVCVSVKSAGTNTKVVFREDKDDDKEQPTYYDFIIPGRKRHNKTLEPNYVYVIYFRKDVKNSLLAFTQL